MVTRDEAEQVSSHLEMTKHSVECHLLADFTADSLCKHLTNSGDLPRCEAHCAPYDQVAQSILQADAEHWSRNPELVVVWTRPERVSPAFGRVLLAEAATEAEVLGEVDAFCDLVSRLEGRVPLCVIPSWVLTLPSRGLGIVDLKTEGGAGYLLAKMNLRLLERFAQSRSVFILDMARLLEGAGKWGRSPRTWYLTKNPFGNDVYAGLARELKAALRALSGKTKKLIVVDLDDTLWGGIVGDVGWKNVLIGGHDAVGEAFADFQKALLSLKNRGVLLALASKNEERTAIEVFEQHPEMVLRKEDIVAWRINWEDKATNVALLASELNLGLDSVVFLDDNPVERDRVRQALPEVFVPDLPQDKLLLASFLRGLDCFDTGFISDIDRNRTGLYISQRSRENARGETGSLENWLEQLGTRLLVEPLNDANWDRALQLLNKTNQMNLTTRRFSDLELREWVGREDVSMSTIRLTDRFGDSGVVGIVSLAMSGARAKILDFVLSCRAMGRDVESAMLWLLLDRARKAGHKTVEATYVPTERNAPCLRFLNRACAGRDGNLFHWQIEAGCSPPKHISIEVR